MSNDQLKEKFPMTDCRLLMFFFFLAQSLPLYGQNFDDLLDELLGSDADQMESQLEDMKTNEETSSISSTDLIGPPEEDEFAPEKNVITNGVTLQGLDKQTGRVFIIDAPIGQTIEFGTLKIVVKHCEKAPIDDRQESMGFIVISEGKPMGLRQKLFSGWMFASSPALSALDHPTYDVWIKKCKELKAISP